MGCPSNEKRLLAAFDFDHTIVHGNTDVETLKLIPEGKTAPEYKAVPGRCWTEFMQDIFDLLHVNGVTSEDYRRVIGVMPLCEGMCELIPALKKMNAEIIILSDSNSVFISNILEKNNLIDMIDAIYTNPGRFDDSGRLCVRRCMEQTECDSCEANICKQQLLNNHVKKRALENVHFGRVMFVGDGRNDFCPTKLLLSSDDLICARVGFHLEKLLQKNLLEKQPVAKLVFWKTAMDILHNLGF